MYEHLKVKKELLWLSVLGCSVETFLLMFDPDGMDNLVLLTPMYNPQLTLTYGGQDLYCMVGHFV
jgi:hypothetical protein